VVVITDRTLHTNNSFVHFEKIERNFHNASKFAPIFKHLAGGKFKNWDNNGTSLYELRCIQRWFILRDFMQQKALSKVFYSDSDNVVYANVTHACEIQRPNCSSIINIEDQRQNYSWVGAGEASLWNIDALNDFCTFTTNIYTHHLDTLQLKAESGSMVVDMSILWLWWVAHHDIDNALTSKWRIGAPFFSRFPNAFENAFKFAKLSLSLPQVNKGSLQLCNGMDVVDRTVFDHRHGWKMGRSYSVAVDNRGLPFIMGVALSNGGQPETLSYPAVHLLRFRRLYFNSIHYQGPAKSKIIEDACKVMITDGSLQFINDVEVRSACANVADTELSTSKSQKDFEKNAVTSFIFDSLIGWLRMQLPI